MVVPVLLDLLNPPFDTEEVQSARTREGTTVLGGTVAPPPLVLLSYPRPETESTPGSKHIRSWSNCS